MENEQKNNSLPRTIQSYTFNSPVGAFIYWNSQQCEIIHIKFFRAMKREYRDVTTSWIFISRSRSTRNLTIEFSTSLFNHRTLIVCIDYRKRPRIWIQDPFVTYGGYFFRERRFRSHSNLHHDEIIIPKRAALMSVITVGDECQSFRMRND